MLFFEKIFWNDDFILIWQEFFRESCFTGEWSFIFNPAWEF